VKAPRLEHFEGLVESFSEQFRVVSLPRPAQQASDPGGRYLWRSMPTLAIHGDSAPRESLNNSRMRVV